MALTNEFVVRKQTPVERFIVLLLREVGIPDFPKQLKKIWLKRGAVVPSVSSKRLCSRVELSSSFSPLINQKPDTQKELYRPSSAASH